MDTQDKALHIAVDFINKKVKDLVMSIATDTNPENDIVKYTANTLNKMMINDLRDIKLALIRAVKEQVRSSAQSWLSEEKTLEYGALVAKFALEKRDILQ